MLKLLALLVMLGWGGYKLHRKSERWIEMLGPLLGAPPRGRGETSAAPRSHAPRRVGAATRPSGSGDAPRSLMDEPPARTSPVKKWGVLVPLYGLALVGLVTMGRFVTDLAVTEGYAGGGTTAEATVGRASAELAYSMLDHPVQRLLLPAWRVVEVRSEKAHCTEPLGEPALRDYVAEVRLYTLFALPYRTVTVTCGGRVW